MNNQSPPSWSQEDWKKEFAEIFFARRAIIFTTAILIFAISLLVAFFWPPTYEATSAILVRGIKPQISPGLLEKLEVKTPTISEEDIASEMQILSSPELIRRTLATLSAEKGKEKVGPAVSASPVVGEKNSEADEKIVAAVKEISSNLYAEIVPSSNVISIKYRDRDPQRAEEILDALLSQYIVYRALIFSPSEEAKFLEGQANTYRGQLEANENDFLKLVQTGGVALIQQEMDNNSLLRKDLSQQLAYARVEYERQSKALEPLVKAIADTEKQMFAFLENESMNRLGSQLALLIQQREDAARDFLDTSPRIKALDEQIKRISDVLKKEAGLILADRRNKVEAIAAGIKQLEDSVAALVTRNIALQTTLVDKDRLDREKKMLEHSYETYARRSEEAKLSTAIAASNTSGDVSILTRAKFSAERAFPIPLQTILAGLFAGIVAGLSLGFLVEYLDHTLDRPSEVHRHLGLPVICSLRKVR